MKTLIRSPKDFWAGLIYVTLGVSTYILAQDYGLGTAMRMGAGYFPATLGIFLSIIGAASLLRSFRTDGEAVERINLRGIFLIVAPIILFALLVRPLGLVLAIPLLVFCSAYASSQFRLLPTLWLAIGLTIACSLVFVKGLGIPLPFIGTLFGA